MKGVLFTHRGFEDVAAREVKEITGASTETTEGTVSFDAKSLAEICSLTYRSQSAAKVMLLLFEFQAWFDYERTCESLKKGLSDTDMSQWLEKDLTFKATCGRLGEHRYTSQDIMLETGRLIKDRTGRDIDLESPDTIFHVQIINSRGYFGVDFSGIDLSKRDYRIFTHPAALKGTAAYCLLRTADYKRTETLLDPFSRSGIIPIEAALFASKTPVNLHRKESLAFMHLKPLTEEEVQQVFAADANRDFKGRIHCIDSSMPSITSAQKNAKLAGVNKLISFSRIEVEWLDTKFSKGEVDRIITSPPEASKKIGQNFADKLYKEFFYQCDYVLAEKGTVTLLARNPEPLIRHASQYKFTPAAERTVFLGKEEWKVLRLGRSS
ncbi:methyltransferase [Candidatus Woesearchaeota archaeon]|nr:methyltransferase [Candidatus Woesearchaeota archaeon]